LAARPLTSVANKRFWRLFHELPDHAQRLAIKNYQLWKSEPTDPSLRFRRLEGGAQDRFSIRIGDHYRALAQVKNDVVTWVWIGTHADYDSMVKSR
jgi:Txe/YoeB family toxin of Txe-Axe toxin-antitoxin module